MASKRRAWKPPRSAQPRITMQAEIGPFNAFVSRFIAGMNSKKGSWAIMSIAQRAMRLIMQKTPVDTGRCRAGWYVGMNALAAAVGGPTYTAGTQAQREGMGRGSIVMNLNGPVKSIVITNGVEYAPRLEYGYSGQAPWGMVRITLMMMRKKQIQPLIWKQLTEMWKNDGRPYWSHWTATKGGPTSVIK